MAWSAAGIAASLAFGVELPSIVAVVAALVIAPTEWPALSGDERAGLR